MIISTQDIALGISGASLLFGAAAFWRAGRKAAIAEGKHLEEVKQLRGEQAKQAGEIQVLQQGKNTTDADIREIKTDLKWIRRALEKSGKDGE